jgi:hypothetical protein
LDEVALDDQQDQVERFAHTELTPSDVARDEKHDEEDDGCANNDVH